MLVVYFKRDKYKSKDEPKTNMLSIFENKYIPVIDLMIHLNF